MRGERGAKLITLQRQQWQKNLERVSRRIGKEQEKERMRHQERASQFARTTSRMEGAQGETNVPSDIHLELGNVSNAVPLVINEPNVDGLNGMINERVRARRLPLRLRLLQTLGRQRDVGRCPSFNCAHSSNTQNFKGYNH